MTSQSVHTLIAALLIGALIGAGSVVLFEPRVERATAGNGPLVGRAGVIDADTIVIHGQRIRLDGIDAPESAQLCKDANARDYQCGQVATSALSVLVASHTVSCDPKGKDRYGRILAVCIADGVDLNRWLVEQGYAVEYTRYAHGQYTGAQNTAKSEKRNLWAGTFEWPWDWRRTHRQ